MRVAIDSNAYSNAARGHQKLVEILKSADEILLPIIVIAELRAGFAHGTQSASNESKLVQFLASPRVSILHISEQTTHHYARLFAFLRTQGTPVPTNDLWIAALISQHDLPLVTDDAHFKKIPQVLLFDHGTL